jgi:glucosamine--fructose-6-phosphate aminotransferase (isomerizing)
MCGIVGYVGPRDAAPIVLEGLSRLEYRGYDSAGLAVIDPQNAISIRRNVGKLSNLLRNFSESPVGGQIGIGHTRWATHGKPSDTNSHPHLNCAGNTVVVHNGIVENFLPLKEELIAEGHEFCSETDTEVIVHLVGKYMAKGLGLEDAARKTIKRLQGAHGIVLMSTLEPDKLVAVRIGNAGGVTLGIGDGEMYVASDIPAILEHTRQMVFLESKEMAVVTRDGYRCSTLDGIPVEKSVTTIAWDPVSAAKGTYKHFMQKEIYEQARAVTDTLRGRVDFERGDVLLPDLGFTTDRARSFNRIVITACGTALYAGMVGKYMLENLVRIPVDVDYGSEFRYRDPVLDGNTLVVAVSQSGETVDTLAALEEARDKGCMTVGVVNVVGSQAGRLCDGTIYMQAGPEIGVASTKAYLTALVDLYMLGLYLGKLRGTIDQGRMCDLVADLTRLPDLVGRVLDDGTDYVGFANRFYKREHFLYLGRGINYPTAMEGALKLKEISYVHAEGYPGGEMKHGPIALIDENMPVVVSAIQDHVYDKILSNIEQIKARDGIVIAIATEGDENIAEKVDEVIYVPWISELLNPVLVVVPMQLIAYHIGVRRGCDVDQPRNLAKSVTVE